ncbi:MAG: ammonium transporter [Aeromicrobium sp.]
MDGYYAWMLMATAMVLFMTVPALALFYGGMTRARSVLNMMMMSYAAVAVVGLVYVLWGWSMSFGSSLAGGFFASPFELFGLDGVSWDGYIGVAFQMTFAIITAALISGAIADRVKFSAWLVFLPLWVTFSYFPLAHMVWGGGFIHDHFPAQDYAGGTVVHINAGLAGGILALIIGRRIGWPREQMRPHNLPLTMMGAALLWFGWYGFNVGSIVFTDGGTEEEHIAQFMSETGVTFMNTTVATMAAILTWLAVEKVLHGKATTLGAASGIVAGLVAITPAAGAVSIVGAIAIGAVSGALCAWAVGLKFKFGLDDSLDVVGVHLVGGLVGTLLIGLLSTADAPGGIDGLFYGGGLESLFNQFMAVVVAVVWTGVFTTLIALAIKQTIGWRVDDEDEATTGIDFAQHGESAYDIAGSTGSSF